jgi:hypothetical protein
MVWFAQRVEPAEEMEGNGLIATDTVAVFTHPLGSVATAVYTPALVLPALLITGLLPVEVNPPGPVHT